MGIFLCIAVSMMHAMHNGICPGIQEGGALCNCSACIKKPFPEFIHGKHFMRCVPVKKKRLAKQG